MSGISKIERNFSRSSSSYDSYAQFQAKVALRLANCMSEHFAKPGAPKTSSIVEFGCGTGFLSAHLMKQFPEANILLTDISMAMLDKCEKKLRPHSEKLSFLPHDFNEPPAFAASKFDLAASSMAFQWGRNLSKTLSNVRSCLTDSGLLFFSIPLAPSLETLREAFKSAEIPYPGIKLPELDSIDNLVHSHFANCSISIHNYFEKHDSMLALLKSLKLSGTMNASDSPVPPKALKRIIRSSGDSVVVANYQVAFCVCIP